MTAPESLFTDDHVTLWLDALRTKDPDAAQQLWNRYSMQLAAVARKKFGALSRRAYDEEDAAISAFRSFCNGVAEERFDDLNDRDNLWRLLVTITARKVNARRRYENRDRRGGSSVHETPLFGVQIAEGVTLADVIESSEPSPEFAAEVAEECALLMRRLDDALMQQIVMLKLEGFNNTEIGERLGCTRHRIQRKLARVRGLLKFANDVAD